ncbi:MAG: hypothetical protein WCG80_05825 [Spirochaetales bacterium]
MKPVWLLAALLGAALVTLAACTESTEETKAPAADENLTPSQLTGIAALDEPGRLELQVLYARGTGLLAGRDKPLAAKDPIEPGRWLVSAAASEFELSFRTSLVTDGIVRLGPSTHMLLERPNPGSPVEARFRVYTGQVSFFFPTLPQNQVVIVTPSGTLVSSGGAFTVTVSPDLQVLVTCREGQVFLTGRQSAAAWPGQVFQFGPGGNNRAWPLTPNQALVFQNRWLQVTTEEVKSVLAPQTPQQLRRFRDLQVRYLRSEAELSALWWQAALLFLPADNEFPTLAEATALWNRAALDRATSGGVLAPEEGLPEGESLLGNRL